VRPLWRLDLKKTEDLLMPGHIDHWSVRRFVHSTPLPQAQLTVCCCDAESDVGENHEWRRSSVGVAHPLVLCERRAVMEVIRP
jgi:hypothetical protein